MPTGYTAYIEDGSITTGKEFLKLCTRAFGIAVEIRDEPLSVPTPTQFSPNTFYRNKYERAVAELDVARSMTIDMTRKSRLLRMRTLASWLGNVLSVAIETRIK